LRHLFCLDITSLCFALADIDILTSVQYPLYMSHVAMRFIRRVVSTADEEK